MERKLTRSLHFAKISLTLNKNTLFMYSLIFIQLHFSLGNIKNHFFSSLICKMN